MMRKTLGSPMDLENLPSLLGRIFRIALYGKDDYNYAQWTDEHSGSSVEQKNAAWKRCRDSLGMYYAPEAENPEEVAAGIGATRQQFVHR
jgi:hypothetical protein